MGVEVLTFLELWFAALQVVVEGYDRSYRHSDSALSDPDVDRLLASGRRSKLRRFRNTVFHVEMRDHPDTVAVLKDYKPFIEWADMLMTHLGIAIVARGAGLRSTKAGRLTSA
jgi:hypothetical protein